jgi:hypothetical protein
MANPNIKPRWKKGQSGNPGGLRKGTVVSGNDFKEWAFNYWKENKTDFEDVIKSDQKTMMDFMKMLANFVPQKHELTGEDGQPLVVRWEK